MLAACAPNRIYLSDSDRAGLRNAPAIHVVRYHTPAPEVRTPSAGHPADGSGLPAVPSGPEIQQDLGSFDPTQEISQRFINSLSRKAGLGNMRLAREATPLPVVADPGIYRDKTRNGLVLEIWVQRWGFHQHPTDIRTYSITLDAGTRLTRTADGRVLWNAGHCSYAGNNPRADRIVLAEMRSNDSRKLQARIKQTVARIADECARQLLQGYLAGRK